MSARRKPKPVIRLISPDRFSTELDHGPWTVTAEWTNVHGRLDPTSVTFAARSDEFVVTADAIRKIPIGQILDELRRGVVSFKSARVSPSTRGSDQWPHQLMRPGVGVGHSKRGQALTDDDLAEVADVYTKAWQRNEPVNEAVRAAFTLSKDGAAKRIGKARAAGLLDGIGQKR